MDKKKIGIAVGCAAVAAVIAICAVTFGGKKGDSRNRCCCRACRHTGADGCSHARCDRRPAACCYRCTPARTAGAEQR